MRDELCEVLTDTDADDAVSVVVLTAVDPVFSAGVDFKEVATQPVASATDAPATNPAAVLREMRSPAICAVNGACVSGALEIALSATFIIASERARFADTHARLGVVAAWGLTALLPRAVGVRKAAEMSITGNFVESEEALRIGLVNHVVPHSDLLPAALRLAHDVAATDAVAEVLDLYRRGDGVTLDEALRLEATHVARRAFDADAFAAAGRATASRASGTAPPSPAPA